MSKAMILAAGKGMRLRPLTETIPKPLITIHGAPMIEHLIKGLHQAGISEIVINVSYLGEQIKNYLQDGSRYGVSIYYSEEVSPLGSGGGLLNALPLLGDEPFIIVNGDIYTDFDYRQLKLPQGSLAHLILVDKMVDVAKGDFDLIQGKVQRSAENPYTYSGIAVIDPALFASCEADVFSIVPLFDAASHNGQLTGDYFSGIWDALDTYERLARLNPVSSDSHDF